MNIPKDNGSYIVSYLLRTATELIIGKLGVCEFPCGYYFYFGNANGSGGLKSRVSRHVKGSVNKFWHIDYFRQIADPQRVWFTLAPHGMECELVQLMERQFCMKSPVRGFGSSDCTEKCESHLLLLTESIDLETIFKSLKINVVDLQEVLIVK